MSSWQDKQHEGDWHGMGTLYACRAPDSLQALAESITTQPTCNLCRFGGQQQFRVHELCDLLKRHSSWQVAEYPSKWVPKQASTRVPVYPSTHVPNLSPQRTFSSLILSLSLLGRKFLIVVELPPAPASEASEACEACEQSVAPTICICNFLKLIGCLPSYVSSMKIAAMTGIWRNVSMEIIIGNCWGVCWLWVTDKGDYYHKVWLPQISGPFRVSCAWYWLRDFKISMAAFCTLNFAWSYLIVVRDWTFFTDWFQDWCCIKILLIHNFSKFLIFMLIYWMILNTQSSVLNCCARLHILIFSIYQLFSFTLLSF